VKVADSEIERRLERFRTASREARVRLTHQRLEILRELASSLEHPTAETVFRAVRKRMPTVSLDTVYRTLWMLNDLGLVTTLGPRRESVRFDANLERHHHYLCVRCGLARDFEFAEFDSLRIPGAAKQFGSVVTTHVEARGVCRRCATARVRRPALPNLNRPRGRHRRRR
jgi:Fur family transcriptional regulator, peroxide stress response regulator